MLLATGPSFEFIRLIQILCWILLPVAFVTILLTVFFHYRQRKKDSRQTIASDEEFIKASPELLGYTNGDGEYIFFDQSSVITEYKKKLSYYHARYTALRHDFDKLEAKYADLADYTVKKFINHKTMNMETNHQQMPKSLQDEIDKLSAEHKTEKEELLRQLKLVNQVNKNLENETQALRDQLNMQPATEDEKFAILNRWKQENSSLKEKVREQQYLQDVLDDKKAQVDFLQSQLEQRIKNSHQLEQQRTQAIAGLEEEKLQHTETNRKIDALKNELLQKQEEADKLQVILCGKEEQLIEKQQVITSKTDQITSLESVLNETKRHNELLQTTAADNKGLASSLQGQLNLSEAKNKQLEQKLATNKQLLQRLNKDISSILGDENGQSPVIALRPEYMSNEEIAAQ